jgi:hypothetical protein
MSHAGLTIHLPERLVHLSSLSYNELASVAIDQERMTKAIAEANEKRRKKMMPGSAGSGSSNGAPPKYRMVYTPPGVSCVDHNSSKIGQSPTIPTVAIPATTVKPCSYPTTIAG